MAKNGQKMPKDGQNAQKMGKKCQKMAKNCLKCPKMAFFRHIWPFFAIFGIFGIFFMYNSAQKAPKMHIKVSFFLVNYKNDKKCAKSY